MYTYIEIQSDISSNTPKKKCIRKESGYENGGGWVVANKRRVTYLCMENILMGARLWIMCFRSSVYIVKTGKLEIYTKHSDVLCIYVLCTQVTLFSGFQLMRVSKILSL